jgi:copper transport protein
MSRCLFALLPLVLGLAVPASAFAHAYLERSSPAGNTIVETAPGRIQIWFTERPELRFSDVTVYTAEGEQVQHGPLTTPADNPRSLVFDLEATPNGTYTVAWKALSADDGHVSAGAFAYAVGLDQPPPTAASIFVPAGQTTEIDRPNVLAVLARWVGYAGAALVGGGPFFLAFVLWPAIRRRDGGRQETDARTQPADLGSTAARRLTLLAFTGVVLVVVGTLGGLFGQAVAISGDDSAALRTNLVDLLTTRGGLLFWSRLLAVAGITLALRRLAVRGWNEAPRDWAVLLVVLASGGLLASQALGAHAAATPIWTSFTIALDWLHLAAMAVWLGGLALIAMVVPAVVAARPEHERPQLLGSIVSRFSSVAVWCVGLLVLTGLYQSWVHVGQTDGLWRTSYGVTLLVKLGLVGPLLVLAAVNLFTVRPGLAVAAAAPARRAAKRVTGLARRLRLAVRGEVLLAAGVLLATGVLTNLPPAREALVQMGRTQTRSVETSGLKMTLTIDPAVAGLNTYDVALADDGGKPLDDAERVALRFRHTQHEMGEIEAVLQPRGDGHYTAQGSYLSMAGLWEVDVRVRPPGREDATVTVEVPAADPSAANPTRAAQAPSLGTSFLLGLELLAAAVLLALSAGRVRLPTGRQLNRLLPRLGAALLGAVGLYFLSVGIMNDLTPTAALANPIPVTRASLERGEQIYLQNCLACHGEYGRGDGPVGRTLRPRPADLQTHTTAHTEGQLYWWITKGFPGSAMPAFEDRLSEEDRWHVLNYIVQTFRPEQ